jgi:3-phenylpropionate/trans-cinnamate dioxygenase ferredoxin component
MADWVDVAPAAEIAPGTCRSVELDGTGIAIFNLDGEFYAIEDVCTHDGGILTGGTIEDDEIVCPRHGAHFSIRTGEVRSPPAYEDVATFPVRVSNGTVQVRNPRGD